MGQLQKRRVRRSQLPRDAERNSSRLTNLILTLRKMDPVPCHPVLLTMSHLHERLTLYFLEVDRGGPLKLSSSFCLFLTRQSLVLLALVFQLLFGWGLFCAF